MHWTSAWLPTKPTQYIMAVSITRKKTVIFSTNVEYLWANWAAIEIGKEYRGDLSQWKIVPKEKGSYRQKGSSKRPPSSRLKARTCSSDNVFFQLYAAIVDWYGAYPLSCGLFGVSWLIVVNNNLLAFMSATSDFRTVKIIQNVKTSHRIYRENRFHLWIS